MKRFLCLLVVCLGLALHVRAMAWPVPGTATEWVTWPLSPSHRFLGDGAQVSFKKQIEHHADWIVCDRLGMPVTVGGCTPYGVIVERGGWGCLGWAWYTAERGGKRWAFAWDHVGSNKTEKDTRAELDSSIARFVEWQSKDHPSRDDGPPHEATKVVFQRWLEPPRCLRAQ